MRSFWFNGGSIAARNGVPVLCSDCPCPNEESSSSSSSSSSSVFTPGLPCVSCQTGTTPPMVKLAVPRVERWESGILVAVLLAGTYELVQDPLHPCCYKIQTATGYWLFFTISNVAMGASWTRTDSPCSGGYFFWSANWGKTLPNEQHNCRDFNGTIPEYNSFGVTPTRPAAITLSL